MRGLAIGLALLLALAIIGVGVQYLLNPRAATRSFGLPLPEEGPNIAWWLRLKGVRDVVSGLLVMTFVAWSGARSVGVILFVYSLIPLGDMLTIIAARGSVKHALGIHGVTATVMLLTAALLTFGVS